MVREPKIWPATRRSASSQAPAAFLLNWPLRKADVAKAKAARILYPPKRRHAAIGRNAA